MSKKKLALHLGGFSGVLVMSALGSNVSADEATPTAAAESTVDASANFVAEVDPVLATPVAVPSGSLDQAVSAANSAGVTVNPVKTENLGVVTSAEQESAIVSKAEGLMNQEVSAITKTVNDYKGQVDSYNKANEKYQSDVKAYEDSVKKYETDKVAYEKALAEYNQKEAERKKALENPTYTTSEDAFPKQNIESFLNKTDLSKISYIKVSESNKGTVQLGDGVRKMTDDELRALYNGSAERIDFGGTIYKGSDATRGIDDFVKELSNAGTTGVINVKRGQKWWFNDVFVDAVTGRSVSLEYTYDGRRVGNSNVIANNGYMFLRDGSNVDMFATAHARDRFLVKLVDTETRKPVTVDGMVLGVGDIDALQGFLIKSDKLQPGALYGENITMKDSGDGFVEFRSNEKTTALSSETAGQAWMLLKNVDGFEYEFSTGGFEPETEGDVNNNFNPVTHKGKSLWGVWHQLGNIDFSLNIPPANEKPLEPKAPGNKPVAPTQPAKPSVTPVKYMYSRAGNVKVVVVTEDGIPVMGDKVTNVVPEGSGYKTDGPDSFFKTPDGKTYKVVEVRGNETGKVTTGETTVTYVVREQVTTGWVDKEGKPLKDPITGDNPLDPGEIPGYRFDKTVPGPNGDVTHVFVKQVPTNWVDKNGNPLKDPVTGDEPMEPGVIPGYKFVESVPDKDGGVTHIFVKLVTTSWVDVDGNSLKDPVTGEEIVDPGQIDGFEFVESIPDKDGNMKHVFRKKVTPIPMMNKPTSVVDTPASSQPVKVLPNTGAVSSLGLVVGGLTSLVGVGLLSKKEQK